MVLVLAARVVAEQQSICSPLRSVDMQLFLEAQAAVSFLGLHRFCELSYLHPLINPICFIWQVPGLCHEEPWTTHHLIQQKELTWHKEVEDNCKR